MVKNLSHDIGIESCKNFKKGNVLENKLKFEERGAYK